MKSIKEQFERINLLHYKLFCEHKEVVQNCVWDVKKEYTEGEIDQKRVCYMLSYCQSCNPDIHSPSHPKLTDKPT